MKLGSIELARTICEELKGELQDDEQYGSVDIAEILSAHVRRLQSELAEAVAANATLHDTCRGYEARLQSLSLGSGCGITTDDKNVRDQREKEKDSDAHSNPLGTVYVLKFPGGNVNCEFVCLGSYQEKEREATHLRMQIGYIVAELQIAGDKRSKPEIVETAAKACA